MLKTGSLHIIWHDIILSRIYSTVCNASVKNGYSNSIYKIETAPNNNIKMPINDTIQIGVCKRACVPFSLCGAAARGSSNENSHKSYYKSSNVFYTQIYVVVYY